MSLEAPSEEAYLQRLLTVQQHERRAALTLADAPAVPQLQLEGDLPEDGMPLQAGPEPVSSDVPSSTVLTAAEHVADVDSFAEPKMHSDSSLRADVLHGGGVTGAAVPAASDRGNSKDAGTSSVHSGRAQHRRGYVSNRRDSSRSDASASASQGGSSSGQSDHCAAAAANGNASDALEPPTPDKVRNLDFYVLFQSNALCVLTCNAARVLGCCSPVQRRACRNST